MKYRRQPWYGCACCPPNIVRTLASLGEHAYHLRGHTIFADLYHEGIVTFEVDGRQASLRQRTRYPWDGIVTFQSLGENPENFTLALRIPSWCRGHTLMLNGVALPGEADPDAYVRVSRTWSQGDTLVLTLRLRAERVYADPRVRADYGKVAIRRGPIVYCLEEADNGAPLSHLRLPPDAPLDCEERADLFGGVVVVRAKAVLASAGSGEDSATSGASGELYTSNEPQGIPTPKQVLFIPYYAWANRTLGEMTVWIRE